MGNRKAAQAVILKYIEALLPGSENTAIYEKLFADMNDKQFDDFMGKLDRGEIRLTVIAPNMGKVSLNTERNLKLAKELGHQFFERLWLTDPITGKLYLSPVKYLVVDLPLRRQAQLLAKKISIPEHNKSVDDYTGQPTGASQGSKLSYPELQILAAAGLDNCIVEMIKPRGGDTKAFDFMNRQISQTGGASLKSIEALGTNVRSTETLSTWLTAAHLKNTGLSKE